MTKPPFDNSDIPQEWIKHYVDQLLDVATKLETGGMRDAVLLRVDNVLDLVQAYRRRNDNKETT